MRKKIRVIALVLAMLMAMTACSSSSDDNSSTRKDASSVKEENYATTEPSDQSTTTDDSETSKKTEYPVDITTYGSDGKEITTTYEEAPEKVLAVYQGSIETMLALGQDHHLIATAGLDNEVPDDMKAAFSSVDYLDEFTPSLETVTALDPDMILSWGSLFSDKTLGDTSTWIEKGTNTYMNSNTRPATGDTSYPRTLDNEYKDILNLGIIFDVQDKAESIVDEMKNTVESVIEETKDIEDKPTTLILESYDDTFSNYGEKTLGGDMVTALGAELAAPEVSEMGKEDIISTNPDVIFVVYMPYSGDDPEELKQEKLDVILKDESFASLDAVKNGRVVPIMLSEMYASATRTLDGITTFANGLYPDLDIQ